VTWCLVSCSGFVIGSHQMFLDLKMLLYLSYPAIGHCTGL
jgi:hypothetical protein